ncbi:30S ribosomal protein S20 [Rubrobacter indicoceani]|uniref:30S ribosomal protein S20 n=1 Tax=Rubrobacter indicoceani TaxID=2051957 RepID=UPI0013C524A3|nr:30S ribosomal protein S20 [Rubrobacter indicoceani]
MPAPSKRDKQSVKKFEQNRGERSNLRNISKNFYRAIESGDVDKAREVRDHAQKSFDNAASRGLLHSNKASRKVSRFDRALAKASAPAE